MSPNITVTIPGLFPGGDYQFEVKAVSVSSESTPRTTTATMCEYMKAEVFVVID